MNKSGAPRTEYRFNVDMPGTGDRVRTVLQAGRSVRLAIASGSKKMSRKLGLSQSDFIMPSRVSMRRRMRHVHLTWKQKMRHKKSCDLNLSS
jgi:hypothetical protein